MASWFLIHRKFFNHYLWTERREFSKAEAWLDLIYQARYKEEEPGKEMISGKIVTWERGQLIASIRFLRKRWNWASNTKVDSFLAMLEKEDMICRKVRQGITRITICNYETYQRPEDTRKDSKKTRIGQREDETVKKEENNGVNNEETNSLKRNDKLLLELEESDFSKNGNAGEDELIDRLTYSIFKMICKNIPNTHQHIKKATISKWREPVRLMHEQDELRLTEIHEVASFATTNDFWATTVSSTSGIRKNLPEIQKAMLKEKSTPKGEKVIGGGSW